MRNKLPQKSDARRDLLISLVLLGCVFLFVLGGLAWDENWRKFLRVLIGAALYVSILLALLRARSKSIKARDGLPLWAFAVAAAAAELASGWLRTNVSEGITFWLAPLAALLIGGVHWLALRSWRPLRQYITGSDSKSNAAVQPDRETRPPAAG
jgi:hypothetical protein